MIQKLINEIVKKDAPIVVGLDPDLKFLPKSILDRKLEEFGTDDKESCLNAVASAILEYNKALIDATYDLIPSAKPQIAMYEQFGVPGVKAFEQTVAYAKQKGLVVIGDVKRGDIGSTSAAYATAHLGSVTVGGKTIAPFDEDFATVNPYFGIDGVKPFTDVCKTHDKGIFLLVKTSNPSSGEFQDRILDDGTTVYETVGRKVVEWGSELMEGDYSNVGAVVGATYPEVGEKMRKLMPNTYILVPGYGAQGGKGKDLKHFFNKDGLGAIINSSRGIIAAYKSEAYAKYGEEHYAEAARAAVLDMRADLKSSL